MHGPSVSYITCASPWGPPEDIACAYVSDLVALFSDTKAQAGDTVREELVSGRTWANLQDFDCLGTAIPKKTSPVAGPCMSIRAADTV